MSDFKLPESYYQPPEFKCPDCGGNDDTCDCCQDCESLIDECTCHPVVEFDQEAATDIVVSVRLEKNTHNALKELAAHHERTISQLVRFAIRDYLNNGAKK